MGNYQPKEKKISICKHKIWNFYRDNLSTRKEGSIIYLEDNYFKRCVNCDIKFDYIKIDYARLDTDSIGTHVEQKFNKANPFYGYGKEYLSMKFEE